MKLPPLPDTSWVDVPHFTYSTEQMRAYGAACADAALEKAAQVCYEIARQYVTGRGGHCGDALTLFAN